MDRWKSYIQFIMTTFFTISNVYSLNNFEGICYHEDLSASPMSWVMSFSFMNSVYPSANACITSCLRINYPIAAIQNAMTCMCFENEAIQNGYLRSGDGRKCSSYCKNLDLCGGENYHLTLYETKPQEKDFVSLSFDENVKTFKVGSPVTAIVEASSEWYIDWGDGFPHSQTDVHTYTIGGLFVISVYLQNNSNIEAHAQAMVHENPSIEVFCPNLLEVSISSYCNVTVQRQGYNYEVVYSLSNHLTTTVVKAHVPAETKKIIGSFLEDKLTDGAMSGSEGTKIIVLRNSHLKDGGYIFRIRVQTEIAGGFISIYAVVPFCDSNKYCGLTNNCLSKCPFEMNSVTCSPFRSDTFSCDSYAEGRKYSPTFTYTFLTNIEIIETNMDEDLPEPIWVPAGARIGFGCMKQDCPMSARVKYRYVHGKEADDSYLETLSGSSKLLSSGKSHMVQIAVREQQIPTFGADLLCETATPFPQSDVPTPYNAATEEFIKKGSMKFSYAVKNPLMKDATFTTPILCQQKVNEPVLLKDFWMAYGTPKEYDIWFSQGAPLFSVLDIDNKAVYDYHDDGQNGYNLKVMLEYENEGLFMFTGNTYNLLGSVKYDSTIHVVPPVTDKWLLDVVCPCFNNEEGFIYTLTLPKTHHPPWNATIEAVLKSNTDSEVLQMNETVDFQTFGNNGKPSSIRKIYRATTETAGSYNLVVRLWNEVSDTEVSQQVEVQEVISGVSASVFIRFAGNIFPASGHNKNIVLVNKTTIFHPYCQTGKPLKWRVEIIETDTVIDISADERDLFYEFLEEGSYTIKIGGYNTIQGWVESPFMTVRSVNKLHNFELSDNNSIIKPVKVQNKVKMIYGEFPIFNPFACVYVCYGDSYCETFGFEERCIDVYPSTSYEGVIIESPFMMKHIYRKEGIYEISAVASDGQESYVSHLKVVIADIPCTMPVITIIDSVKVPQVSRQIWRSFQTLIQTRADYHCNGTVPVRRWWTLAEVDPTLGVSIQDIHIENVFPSWNYSQLSIPSNYLTYGVYKVSYYFSILARPDITLERFDYTYINITKTPLTAIIVEGSPSKISRGFGQLINLDPGSFSKDPDYPLDSTLNFTWWCRQISPREDVFDKDIDGKITVYNEQEIPEPLTTRGKDGCFGYGAGTLVPSFEKKRFNTASFAIQEGTLEFVLKLQKKERYSYVSLIVELSREATPTVVITCDPTYCFHQRSSLIFNPAHRVVLSGRCTSDCSERITYKWTVTSSDGQLLKRSEICEKKVSEGGTDCVISTQVDGEIILWPIFFSSNPTTDDFQVRLTLMTADHRDGFTDIIINKNKPPEGGYCSMNETSGYALTTNFEVNCSNWIDPEELGIVSYSFFFYDTKPDQATKTYLASSSQSIINLIFPVGNFSLMVEISDMLYGTTMLSLEDVTAFLPDEDMIANYDYGSKIDYFSTIGDQTTLGMISNALSSIRNVAETFTLDANALSNMTSDEVKGRLTNVSKINNDQLKVIRNSMNFETLSQINVGANIVSEVVSGIFQNNMSSLTVDMESRELALVVLEDLSDKVRDIHISSPKDLEPFLSSSMNAADALMTGVAQVLEIGEKNGIVPPTDEEKAPYLDYNTDIGDYDMVVPNEEDEMYKRNVLDTTRMQAKKQVERINNIVNTTLVEIRNRMASGEKIETTALHGTSILIWKQTEDDIASGLKIHLNNSNAKITIPEGFCPSKYVYENTNCQKEIAITIVVWPSINYMYPKSTSLLAPGTSVVQFEVSIENSLVILVNESNAITIDIPRTEGEITDTSIVNTRDSMSIHQNFVYHNFNLSATESGFIIEIKPYQNSFPSNIVLLIDHERMPTPSEYMFIKSINEFEKYVSGTHRYLVTSEENRNKTGRFFIGIGALKSETKVYNEEFTKDDFENKLNLSYYLHIHSSGCYFFDGSSEEWKTEGLKMVGASNLTVTCETIHATSFGSGYFSLINTIDFQYIFANPGFVDNLTVYVTLVILFSLYIFLLICGHWMDRRDIEHRSVIPLPDNVHDDKYLYEITFHTGPDKEASTKSNIKFILSGDLDETSVRSLPSTKLYLFRRFSIDSFVMSTPRPLGDLTYLRIFHDNSGEPPFDSWQVQMVVVRDLHTKAKYIFDTKAWLAFNRDEATIDKVFTPTARDEKQTVQNIYSHCNKVTNDDQMWMSIFLRPPGSRFLRKERVTVCFVYLFLSMFFSAIWYNYSTESKLHNIVISSLVTISIKQFVTGTCILFISSPIVYLLTFVFKRARPKTLKKCRAILSMEKQRMSYYAEKGLADENIHVLSKTETKVATKSTPKDHSTKICLPWWSRIIGWVFSISVILATGFFVWSYGIMWGDTKTTEWLSTFVLSFFLSLIIGQWVKVMFLSFLSSVVIKYDLSTEDIDCDEELPTLKSDEIWCHQRPIDPSVRRKIHAIKGVDNSDPEVEKIRKRLLKQREMNSVMKEIFLYCLFLFIVLVIASEKTDRNSILLQNHIQNTFIKTGSETLDYSSKVKTTDDWWIWAKEVILQELRAQRNYNNDPPYGLRGFLNDRSNRIIGYAILRQIRSKRHNCAAPKPLDEIINSCSGGRGPEEEDTQSYCAQWMSNATFGGSCKWSEFHYKSSDELKTFPYIGNLGLYSGGGYVFKLSGLQNDLLARMDELQRNHWIDKNTRAVFLEFSIYNANVNLFSICTILAEFNEGGGVIPKWRFDPIKLTKRPGSEDMFYYVCEVLFVLSLIIFTMKELWEIKSLKLKYFDSYWNIAELCILIISYITVGLYFYSYILTQEALKIFKITHGNGYIRMDSAALVDQYYIYGLATVVFFSILKLIKLLQFNKRMDVLALTIKGCWKDLKVFLFAFAIVFFAFACLFLFMYSSNIQHFARLVSAIQSTFKMMMGKFDSKEMNEVNTLSPLLFFIFSLINNMIMVNIMLTIVIQAFNQVKNELENKENRLDLIDYVYSSFLQFLRLQNLPKTHVEPKLTKKTEEIPSPARQSNIENNLSDKVNELAKYVNSVYFDSHEVLKDSRYSKSLFKTPQDENNMTQHKTNIPRRKIYGSE